MAGLLDWLGDTGLFGGSGGGAQPTFPADNAGAVSLPPAQTPPTQPADNPAPSADPKGINQPSPVDVSTSDIGGGLPPGGTGAPVPMPQPRPAGAPGPVPPAPSPAAAPSAPPPGAPLSITSPAQNAMAQGAPPPPAQTAFGRALGITPDQAGMQGRQIMSGIGAGLKSVGDNWNKPGLAAFAGSAGAAIEGGNKEEQVQQKEAADYLKSAIDAQRAGDEAGYKQNYLQYLAATLKQKTDQAASSANKNDSPTQLYLSANRLVQPDRIAMNKALQQMEANGAKPEEIAAARAKMEGDINARLAQHYANLGLNPKTAQQIAKQPGNSQDNPIDGKKEGLTAGNIGQKLKPGQYYTNPSDGRLMIYRGPQAPGAAPPAVLTNPSDTSTPAPINPLKPYKTPAAPSDDDEE